MAKELRDFASGTRADAIMSAIARKMRPEDVNDVSEYYSSRHAISTPAPVAAPNLLTLGTQLATVGDEEKHIQACEGCHGPQGRGEAPAIPPLAVQYAHYIVFQMQMWQKGYRKNDANQQMANIASRLSPKEVEAIGLYFERLAQADLANKGRQQ
jgi:cytochrome c553